MAAAPAAAGVAAPTDAQCCLCLSCGAPFKMTSNDFNPLENIGNVSFRYMDQEVREDRQMRRRFNEPKLMGQREGTHVFHASHHGPAIRFVSTFLQADAHILRPSKGDAITGANGIAYYRTPTGSGDKNPQVARWIRPAPEDRLDMGPIIQFIERYVPAADAAMGPGGLDHGFTDSTRGTLAMCKHCNALMTGQSYYNYHLGVKGSAERNGFGTIIHDSPIWVSKAAVNGRTDMEEAYGNWTRSREANNHWWNLPSRTHADSLTPAVAYFLHMCLPYDYAGMNVPPTSGVAAHTNFVEICWLMLEIACLSSTLYIGKTYGNGRMSAGMAQNRGVLDFYVSYAVWRLARLEFWAALEASPIDFVQFHQKYYSEADRCEEMFPASDRVIGQLVCENPMMNSRRLVETIAVGVVRLYKRRFRPIFYYILESRTHRVPRWIEDYFVSPRMIADHLIPLSTSHIQLSTSHIQDVDTALQQIGVGALMSRMLALNKDAPPKVVAMFRNFRATIQGMEIQNMQREMGLHSRRSAEMAYAVCNLLQPPRTMPKNDAVMVRIIYGRTCSLWASCMTLNRAGAFTRKLV